MKDFSALFAKAHAAGCAAAEAHTPIPMVVSESDVFTGKPTFGGKQYVVPSGVCGFAWVHMKGNSAFGRWMKKTGKARAAYQGGLDYWISAYNQSMERKEAYAMAFADVVRAAGVEGVYAGSRMD